MLSRIKESFHEHYADNPLKTIFYLLVSLSVLVIIIAGLVTDGRVIKDMLFQADSFSGLDFFECLRTDMHMGPDIYPPLAQLFYYALGTLVIPFADGVPANEYRNTQMGFFIYSLYLVVVYVLLYRAISKMKKGTEREKNVFFILTMFSLPSLFLLERSNIIAFVLVFVLLFFNGYDSEDKKIRYMSYLCLAIATGLKLYPAFFGLILLRTKKAKEIAICVLIGLVVFLTPFIFSDGSLLQFFGNIFAYSGSVSSIPRSNHINLNNLVTLIYGAFESTAPELLVYIIAVVLLIISVIAVVFNRKAESWKIISLLILSILLLTSFKPVYAIMFMIIPLILFLDSKNPMSKLNIIYLACFILMFMPMFEIFFDLNAEFPVPISFFAEVISLIVMFILLICETLPDALRNIGLFSAKKTE